MLAREQSRKNNPSNAVQVVTFTHTHYKTASIYFDPGALDLMEINNEEDRHFLMQNIAAVLAYGEKSSTEKIFHFYVDKVAPAASHTCKISGIDAHHHVINPTVLNNIQLNEPNVMEGIAFTIKDALPGKDLPDYFNSHSTTDVSRIFALCHSNSNYLEKSCNDHQKKIGQEELDAFLQGKIDITPVRRPCPQRQLHGYDFNEAAQDFPYLLEIKNILNVRNGQLTHDIEKTAGELELLEKKEREMIARANPHQQIIEYIQDEFKQLRLGLNESSTLFKAKKDEIAKFFGQPGFAEKYVAYLNDNKEPLVHLKQLLAWTLYEAAANYFACIQKQFKNTKRKAKLNTLNTAFEGIASVQGKRLVFCDELREEFARLSLKEIGEFINALLLKCDTGLFASDKQKAILDALEKTDAQAGLFQTKSPLILNEKNRELENTLASHQRQVAACLNKECDMMLASINDRNLNGLISHNQSARETSIQKIEERIRFLRARERLAELIIESDFLNIEIEEANTLINGKETSSVISYAVNKAKLFLESVTVLPEGRADKERVFSQAKENIDSLENFYKDQCEKLLALKKTYAQERQKQDLALLREELSLTIASYGGALNWLAEVENYFSNDLMLKMHFHHYQVNMNAVLGHARSCNDYSHELIGQTRLWLAGVNQQLDIDFKAVRDGLALKKENTAKKKGETPAAKFKPVLLSPITSRASGVFDNLPEWEKAPDSPGVGKHHSPPQQEQPGPRSVLIEPKIRKSRRGKIIGVLAGAGIGALVGAGIGAFIGFCLAPVTLGASIPTLAAAGAVIGASLGGLVSGGVIGLGLGHLYDRKQQKTELVVTPNNDYPSPMGDYPRAVLRTETAASQRKEEENNTSEEEKRSLDDFIEKLSQASLRRRSKTPASSECMRKHGFAFDSSSPPEERPEEGIEMRRKNQ